MGTLCQGNVNGINYRSRWVGGRVRVRVRLRGKCTSGCKFKLKCRGDRERRYLGTEGL